MAESKNLYQRLLAITEEIGKIDKTGTNSSQGYKFIEQALVVAEVRVQLAKHGVVIIPETVSRTLDRYTKMVPGYKSTDPQKEQATYHANVASRYTLVNADNPEERMVCEWDAGEALDTSDKATNKATTASQKYFLMKLFNISDKDDPDQESPQAPVKNEAAQTPAQAQTQGAGPLIHPELMMELRTALRAADMLGDMATRFVTNVLGYPTPKSNDDAQAVIDALKELGKPDETRKDLR